MTTKPGKHTGSTPPDGHSRNDALPPTSYATARHMRHGGRIINRSSLSTMLATGGQLV